MPTRVPQVICYVYFTRITAILLRGRGGGAGPARRSGRGGRETLVGLLGAGRHPSSWTASLPSVSRMTDSGFQESLSKVNKTASGRELL